MSKYVIDGTTLTNIADAIRRASPYDYQTITPEEMPQCIEAGVRDPAFDDGYEYGYAKGQTEGLEALGALGEWNVVITSEDYYSIAIRNFHPSYYLHCDIVYIGGDGQSNFVVSPNSVRSWESGGSWEYDEYLSVKNVRWKASAT